ncbi:hypothetical protein PJP07_29855, partial [Mycobacterium kansasii]
EEQKGKAHYRLEIQPIKYHQVSLWLLNFDDRAVVILVHPQLNILRNHQYANMQLSAMRVIIGNGMTRSIVINLVLRIFFFSFLFFFFIFLFF